MPLKKIMCIWVGALALLVLLSYKSPGFGVALLCTSLILFGLVNHFLSIQSRKLGLITGSSASILALAACAGAGLSPLEIAALTVVSAIAGYCFAVMPVELTESEAPNKNDDNSPRSKIGGGGGFDGGGASGNF